MALANEELKAALESYRLMDPSREGPYRTLQLVTIFIFIIHCLTENHKGEVHKDDNKPESSLTELALTATFICTGRIVERCTNGGGDLEECPLLPTVLVFVEWLANTLERAEAHMADERVTSAMSYFFGALADLLNRIELSTEGADSDNSAIWEDHELNGFDPMAHAHVNLDFAGHRECMDSFSRSRRIFLVGIKLAARSGDSVHNWIGYDNLGKRFSTNEQRDSQNHSGFNITTEEEEVILFKPITRYNSAPASTSRGPSSDRVSAEEGAENSDESLRRASSLFVGQNQTEPETDTFSFRPETTNSRFSSPLKPREPAYYPAGPPSLKAWVIDNESGPESFNALSVNNETKDPISGYVSPVPSAPFLPEGGDGILGASPTSGYTYTNWHAARGPFNFIRGPPSFLEGYSPPLQGMMSSSEWLYHHRSRANNNNNNHLWIPYGNPNATNNVARYDLLDPWGNPLVSSPYLESPMLPSPLIDKSRFGCERSEPLPLLQYLKEREVQLQQEYEFRGPSFMGN